MALECPLRTSLPHSAFEATHAGVHPPEIRAYKLGKKRWSYNQVELVLGEAGGNRQATVLQATHSAAQFPESHQDSAVSFLVQLKSGQKLQVHIYLCYEQRKQRPHHASQTADLAAPPIPLPLASAAVNGHQAQAAADAVAAAAGASNSDNLHSWRLVVRSHCRKGCSGPTLRSIQRFGRLGKRSWSESTSSAAADHAAGGAQPSASSMKDPKFMYLSLDEACTHVDASAFRLVAGIYNRQGTRLLATSVSPPIRVLANNDVPTGAARIPLEACLPADWEGWGAEEAAMALPDVPRAQGDADGRRKVTLRSSGSPPSDGNQAEDMLEGAPSMERRHSQPGMERRHSQPGMERRHSQPGMERRHSQPGMERRHSQPRKQQQQVAVPVQQLHRANSGAMPLASAAAVAFASQQQQQQEQQQQQQQQQQQGQQTLMQQLQQFQQLQQLQQLQQFQQQQPAWQQPLPSPNGDQLQQLSQLLQLLQTIHGTNAAGAPSLGQSQPFPGASAALSPFQLPLANPAPDAAVGGLLAGLPPFSGAPTVSNPAQLPPGLLSLLTGASLPPPAGLAWPAVPPAPAVSAAAGTLPAQPAQPHSPAAGDGIAKQHSDPAARQQQALQQVLLWAASQGKPDGGGAGPSAGSSQGLQQLTSGMSAPMTSAVAHPSPMTNAGAPDVKPPPTSSDVPMDAMIMLADLAAAADLAQSNSP